MCCFYLHHSPLFDSAVVPSSVRRNSQCPLSGMLNDSRDVDVLGCFCCVLTLVAVYYYYVDGVIRSCYNADVFGAVI